MAMTASLAATGQRRQTISDLPVQHARDPKSPAESRARFFNPGNAFDIQLPAVPDHIFTAEPALALDPATNKARYSDATTLLDEIVNNQSERY